MTAHAAGTFFVKLTPHSALEGVEEPTIGRMTLDKQYFGELEAASKGQMLSGMGEVPGSGGYVAMERVAGVLHSRVGTFALQHSGTMAAGSRELSVTVVPDSGTGALAGISGHMNIKIEDGKHFYEFDYALPGDGNE